MIGSKDDDNDDDDNDDDDDGDDDDKVLIRVNRSFRKKDFIGSSLSFALMVFK